MKEKKMEQKEIIDMIMECERKGEPYIGRLIISADMRGLPAKFNDNIANRYRVIIRQKDIDEAEVYAENAIPRYREDEVKNLWYRTDYIKNDCSVKEYKLTEKQTNSLIKGVINHLNNREIKFKVKENLEEKLKDKAIFCVDAFFDEKKDSFGSYSNILNKQSANNLDKFILEFKKYLDKRLTKIKMTSSYSQWEDGRF